MRREITVTPGKKPPQITGLALDEAKGRIWVATADDGRVRCFALDGTPVEITPINVPRAGGLALDHTGALWVIHTALPLKEEQITGKVFAATAAQGHAAEFATETSDKAWYQAAGTNGFCGLEFSQPTRLAGLRFVGGGESSYVGGKVEVSAHVTQHCPPFRYRLTERGRSLAKRPHRQVFCNLSFHTQTFCARKQVRSPNSPPGISL